MAKRLISALAAIIIASVSATAQNDTLRVLAIGNSFSEDAVEQNLHEIGLADGKVLIIGNLCIGGCTLERHYNNAKKNKPDYSFRKIGADGVRTKREKTTMAYGFRNEPWDVVSFQQSSGLSGKIETYEPYLPYLVNYARQRTHKGSRIMLHQTWAYAKNATHKYFYRYGNDQKQMYDSLCNAYGSMAEKYGLELIPSGTAIQNSRGTFTGENATRDGYHLSYWFGRYMAACTWYEAITGRNVVGNAWQHPHLSPERITNAQRCAHAAAQHPLAVSKVKTPDFGGNYDPAKIPAYTLPDPLKMQDGSPVTTPEQWYAQRRPELLELFSEEMFGKVPGKQLEASYETVEAGAPAFDGKAIRHEVRISFGKGRPIQLLIYTPSDAEGPVPTFLGINFKGNISIADDPGIHEIPEETRKLYRILPQVERGSSAGRWPVEEIVARGYGVATFHTCDIDTDYDEGGGRNGIAGLFLREDQEHSDADQWGTIAQWAWGLSRALDYLETYDKVDGAKVAVIGHSRLGKTALWAGATDERFAMAISNDSGCCGAALSRRRIGETVNSINNYFPHWFCENFHKYGNREDELPFDQHELLALMAPRPVYVASAERDGWSDPVGERLSEQEAAKVYKFLGLDTDMLGYHIREGRHNITIEDWEHYMDFADRYLK